MGECVCAGVLGYGRVLCVWPIVSANTYFINNLQLVCLGFAHPLWANDDDDEHLLHFDDCHIHGGPI